MDQGDEPTRRAALLGLGASAVALVSGAARLSADHSSRGHGAGPGSKEKPAKPFPFGHEPPRLRKSFYDFTDAEVRTLRDAIGYMRDGLKAHPLPVDRPLQWDQYVSTHAHHCTEQADYFPVHWSWFFLPWHRAYLFFLERHLANIVTTIFKGDGAKFALPYWNWETQRMIPNTKERIAAKKASPFFGYNLDTDDINDPDPMNLALWDGYRGPTFDKPEMKPENEPGPNWQGHTALTLYFTRPEYIQSLLSKTFEDFAGKAVPQYPAGQGLLEMNPHNLIHDWVGSRYGSNRDMGVLRYAALDPIFSLHHANIDRIWSHYQGQPESTVIGDWYRQWFNFYDLDGSLVSVSVEDTIKKMDNVRYEHSRFWLAGREPFVVKAPSQVERTVLVAESKTLTTGPITLKTTEAREKLSRLEPGRAAPTNSLLEIEVTGLSYSGKFYVRVFVNKENADLKTPVTDKHFVGLIGALDSHASHGHAGIEANYTFLVDVSKGVSNFYDVAPPGKPFTITLVPAGTAGSLKDFKLTVKSVTLKVY
jgi:polyphenol oxidase